MKPRFAQQLVDLLAQFPAVVLLGPQRQLDDPEGFLLAQRHRLVILDEAQRMPELFAVLRGIIDIRRQDGEPAGQFLLLGSASGVLLQQASEGRAGRVAPLELTPFQAREVLPPTAVGADLHPFWVRGRFPLSWLAPDDAASLRWREAFIAIYLERDIPILGSRIPAITLRRLWTMLAHAQGGLLNQAQLAASRAVSGQTVARYIDILTDLMLVRRLPAWHGNVGKWLVRAQGVRAEQWHRACAAWLDEPGSGLGPLGGRRELGRFRDRTIARRRTPGRSQLLSHLARGEADLVLDFRNGKTWVVEIKRASAPTVSKGFHLAAANVGAIRKLLVAPVAALYPMRDSIEVMNPLTAVAQVAGQP